MSHRPVCARRDSAAHSRSPAVSPSPSRSPAKALGSSPRPQRQVTHPPSTLDILQHSIMNMSFCTALNHARVTVYCFLRPLGPSPRTLMAKCSPTITLQSCSFSAVQRAQLPDSASRSHLTAALRRSKALFAPAMAQQTAAPAVATFSPTASPRCRYCKAVFCVAFC